MKDALQIKKTLLQTLIGSLKDGEGEAMKNRPSVTAVSLQKGMDDAKDEEECDTEEGSGEADEMDLEDEDTLARLKKLFGAE